MSKRKRKNKGKQNGISNLTFADIERLSDLFGVASNPSGIKVSETTAMKFSAVYACVRIIAGAIASLPLKIYINTPDGPELRERHPSQGMLSLQPNPIMTAMVFWEGLLYYLLLTGNGYALIGRNQAGQPFSLSLLKSSSVWPELVDGRLHYRITMDDGKYVVFDQDDILHIPGLGWDGTKGMSVIGSQAVSIGTGLAQNEYSARFFSNGARPDGVIKYPKKLGKDQAEILRDYWYNVHQGAEKSHLPAILTEGGDYTQVSMSAQDSQLIESRRFQVADIGRIYGVPLHMIGETEKSTSWGSGLEEQVTGFVMFTLRPLVKRVEQELSVKIIRSARHYVEFSLQGLLRGDTKTRHESYKVGVGGNQQPGYMTINEVRKLENLPPLPGGDELYKPATGTTNEDLDNDETQQARATLQGQRATRH